MSKTLTENGTATSNPVSYDSAYSAYSVTSLENAYHDHNNTTYAQINLTRNANAVTQIYYNFSLNIPSGATINSVSCMAKCYISNTQSSRVPTREIRLYSGTTAKGSAYTVSTSTTAFTVTAGTWTAAELASAKIRLYAQRGTSSTTSNYYFRFYGATITVNYTYQYVAYEVTTSSTAPGVTMTPSSADVPAGEDQPIEIFGDMTGVTVTDNGNDVTSQLVVKHPFQPSYSVATRSGMTYGFNLSNGWYESTNKAVNNSAALSRVTFNLPVPCDVTFTYINYAEGTYDFGIFSKLDTALTTNYPVSSSNGGDTTIDNGLYEKRCNASADNTSSQKTLVYSMTAGEHFVDVKFGKDAGSSENNDSLRFQVAITPLATVPTEDYYEYVLANVSGDHVIVAAVVATGDKIHVNVNGTWKEAQEVYVKSGGSWKNVLKVYKKVSGAWVEQQDKSALFDSNVIFV